MNNENIGSKRIYLLRSLLIFVVLSCLLSMPVFASGREEIKSVPSPYASLIDEISDEVGEFLPEDIHSEDIDELGEAVRKMSSPEYLLAFFQNAVGLGINDAISLFVSLCGILCLSAVFSAFKGSFISEGIARAVSISSGVALFGCVMSVQTVHFLRVEEFFDRLSMIMNGMIPTIGIIYAMGGNLGTAAASSSTLYIFLAFCEEICRTSVLPVAAVCTAFSLCGTVSSTVKLGGLSSAIKKTYTFILGLIMTVLLAVLSSQTLLTSAADTVSARAAKLVATNVIPIVGSSVGDTLRTLSSSVGYIKSVCGVGGIIFILLLVLPTLITLLLSRGVFIFAVAIADLIGCDNESKLLSELGSVYGVLIAVVAMCAIMFVLAITIFLRCGIAVG